MRRFECVAAQAGYTAAEFGEGIENNYFLTPHNRSQWEKGHKAFRGANYREVTRIVKSNLRVARINKGKAPHTKARHVVRPDW